MAERKVLLSFFIVPYRKTRSASWDGMHTLRGIRDGSPEIKFESDIDMSLSNSTDAATFGKTGFADFASVKYKEEE